MFGNLTTAAIPHDWNTLGATGTFIVAAIIIVAALTYYKRWTWLWKEWLTTVDAKKIGVMYIIVSILMFLRGMIDVVMMRLQQAVSVGSSQGIMSADHFQQVFTAHGTIMIFFVAMGLMFGIINLIVPLQIGARDVAFPFLNSVSFWLFVAGAIFMNLFFVIGGQFAATGWLAYPPLSELAYSPGVGVDYWIWSLQIAGIGSLLSGINFLVTILKMRAPGMSLMKMPMFVWSVLNAMLLVVFAFPILTGTLGMLSLDRLLGMHFFTATNGGNAMMYVNLIWAWGHPEVYILILPAFGIFSEVVATFSQKRLFGYASMVYALLLIMLLSFFVWLHHFFTMGAGANVNAFFGMMTAVIAIPTGVKVFNWIFTMFRGRIRFTTPMLWFLGFVVTFTIGGVAGVMMSVPAIDYQVHNTLFLVAHFHMMIVGGVLFGYFAGITYWAPKIIGFKLNEKTGTYAFWFWFIGFLVAFIPLYILGLMGATRRLDHYDPSMGWQGLFMVAGIGAGILIIGVAFQLLQIVVSIYQRNDNRDTTGDPWNGRTLEWSVPSPVPFYNFAVLPVVHERDAWWATKQAGVQNSTPTYTDIILPKNTGIGMYIAALCFILSFALVWHIFWLIPLSILGIIACIIVRSIDEDTEYTVHAADIKKI